MSTPRYGGGGNKLGEETPRSRQGTFYSPRLTPRSRQGTFYSPRLTPRNYGARFVRVKTPQQLATAAAALHARKKSIQRYGAGASLLRTPKDVPRIVKVLKRLAESRWDSPRKQNRFRNAMKKTPVVSAWNERRYQQANEVNNRRRPFRRNQNTYVRRNDEFRGGRVNRCDEDNSRFAMRNPIQISTQYLRNPLSETNGRDFLPVFPGPSRVANPSSSSNLTAGNSKEQMISAFGMNMYVPPLIEQKGKLRPIVIDGSNVAMGHGNNEVFSCKGIKICVQYFKKLGHETVLAFVPRYRKKLSQSIDTHILNELEKEGVVKYTPSRDLDDGRRISSYDDRYVVQCAAAMGGIIVSNDNFRDLMLEQPTWRKIIETKILQFTWITDDSIMFPPDPLGRHGPALEEFLRF